MTNSIELACFEINQHGRLLSGNRRFCRMFGFEMSEIPWHYITDLYRYPNEWAEYRDSTQASFVARLKNRRGRSFKCNIVREVVQNDDGEIIFRNTVHKVSEGRLSSPQAMPLSMVFLARCSDCGAQIRVASASETRRRILCDSCAARAFPETFYGSVAQV